MTRNVQLNGRVEPELLLRVRQEAKKNRRSIGQEIACLIEHALDDRDREAKAERRQEARSAVPAK